MQRENKVNYLVRVKSLLFESCFSSETPALTLIFFLIFFFQITSSSILYSQTVISYSRLYNITVHFITLLCARGCEYLRAEKRVTLVCAGGITEPRQLWQHSSVTRFGKNWKNIVLMSCHTIPGRYYIRGQACPLVSCFNKQNLGLGYSTPSLVLKG